MFKHLFIIVAAFCCVACGNDDSDGPLPNPNPNPQPKDTVFLKDVPFNPEPDTTLTLVFADEFEGASLDWNKWGSESYGSNTKNNTSRGPDNAKVEDGELRLYVKKETKTFSGKTTEWTSAYVFLKETLEPNSYIETRFKPTQCTGVNNAFWTACRTNSGDSISNRYEIDMVETRMDTRKSGSVGNAHLAWHDWKTYSYSTEGGSNADNASGSSFNHDFSAYQTWALCLGEKDFSIRHEGVEKWDGKTSSMAARKTIWYDGQGKLDGGFTPSENVAKKAYGNFGQSDWCYYGGYSGDKMNLVFANLPWPETWTPLTDDADGTYMAVEYVRIYRPKYTQNTAPLQSIVLDSVLFEKSRTTGSVTAQNKVATITSESSIDIALDHQYSLEKNQNIYLSLVLKKQPGAIAQVVLKQADESSVLSFGVNASNSLTLGADKVINSGNALPSKNKILFEDNTEYKLILRISAKEKESDIISVISYKQSALPQKEPYLYHNFDADGNTSVNNGWHLNRRISSDKILRYFTIENSGSGNISVKNIKIGTSYISVL